MRILITACAALFAIGPLAAAQSNESEAETSPAAEAVTFDAPVELARLPYDLTPMVCPFKSDIDYKPGAIECGRITVPENRERADSRAIRLHYVRIAAFGEDESAHRADPVIYLTGGPGVGVGGYVARLKDHPVAEHRDLYILEQRGIGDSGQFCRRYADTAPEMDWADNLETRERASTARMLACFDEARANGVDLSGYNTVENARDVQALREALGFESWNIWGISYGSHLGQMLLNVDPQGIRAIVLDAIVPNDLVGLMDIHRIFDQVFENYLSTCDDSAACEDLEARFFAAIESLQDDPVIVEVHDTERFPRGEFWVPPMVLGYLPFMMAYEQDEHPAAPAVMSALADAVLERDETVLKGLGAAMSSDDADGFTVAQGMSDAIRCNDGYTAEAARAIEADLAAYPHLAGLISTTQTAREAAQACVEAGLAPRDRADYAIPQTERPTLVVNGAWDPVTPPWLAERVANEIPGARYIETPYAGHGPTRSMAECGGAVMTAFFDNPDVDALNAECLEEGVEPPVYLDLMTTTAPLKAMTKLERGPEDMLPSAGWLAASILPLLLAIIMLPLGWIGRVIDRTPAMELAAETGGARLFGFLAALTGAAGLTAIGYGAYAASEVSMVALIAGFAAPAGLGGWLILASGALGAITLIAIVRAAFGETRVRIGTLLGLFIIGAAALSLAGFAFTWDLTPF